ncbi:hypothetical protein FNF31_07775 [Cafeteria roenbergensis]|uniref:Uncharacterized protein n=1 Tax=Cafeteria roenbergensis TaxID=33653 RepID=A0A5A8C0V5_CAFRO|nr:hypothetical protein FNF31_07775 [Cafeteria roenbergensis]
MPRAVAKAKRSRRRSVSARGIRDLRVPAAARVRLTPQAEGGLAEPQQVVAAGDVFGAVMFAVRSMGAAFAPENGSVDLVQSERAGSRLGQAKPQISSTAGSGSPVTVVHGDTG